MVLNSEGFDARAVYSGEEGVELARSIEFDFLVTGVVMPQMNGIDAAIQIRKLLPKCKILLVSGDNDTSALLHMLSLKATGLKYSPSPCILWCSSRRFAQSSPDRRPRCACCDVELPNTRSSKPRPRAFLIAA